MADHGKNRRRSFFARRRQARGKHKAFMSTLEVRKKIIYWWNHWHKPIQTDYNKGEK